MSPDEERDALREEILDYIENRPEHRPLLLWVIKGMIEVLEEEQAEGVHEYPEMVPGEDT